MTIQQLLKKEGFSHKIVHSVAHNFYGYSDIKETYLFYSLSKAQKKIEELYISYQKDYPEEVEKEENGFNHSSGDYCHSFQIEKI